MNKGSPVEDRKSDTLRVYFSLSHLADVCRRSLLIIFIGSSFLASLSIFYASIRPIYYTVSATFHDDDVKGDGIDLSLGPLKVDPPEGKGSSRALALMRSRKVLEPLIRKLHLQAALAPSQGGWIHNIGNKLNRIQSNWRAEKAHMSRIEEPVTPDHPSPLFFSQLEYSGEFKRQLEIRFFNTESYSVHRLDGSQIGSSSIGHPFQWKGVRFTLQRHTSAPWSDSIYTLTLFPMAAVVDNVSKKIRISPDRDNEKILYLSLSGGNRKLAAQVLNGIMQGYVDFLRKELRNQIQEKLNYLQERQRSLVDQLEAKLNKKAQDLGESGNLEGLLDYKSQLRLITMRQEKLDKSLSEVTMQIDTLSTYAPEKENSLASVMAILPTVRSLHSKLQGLEKRRETLMREQKALQNQVPKDKGQNAATLTAKASRLPEQSPVALSLLDHYRRCPLQAKTLTRFTHGEPIYSAICYTLKRLFEWRPFNGERKQLVFCLSSFMPFKRRAINTTNPEPEVLIQGLDIHAATQLYTAYTKTWDDVQKQIKSYNIAKAKLKNPNFAISSLSGQLNDNISTTLIDEAGEIRTKLGDRTYYASKERQRYRKQLKEKRQVLQKHLRQKLYLLKQNETFYQRQIHSLLGHMILLLTREISGLQAEIDSSIHAQKQALTQQLSLLQQQRDKISQPLSRMPEKWAEEQEFEMRSKMEIQKVQALTKVVEALSISQDVDSTQSKTIDSAIPPILPHPPRILKHGLYGFLWGATLTIIAIIAHGLLRGFQANAINLELAGCTVVGRLFDDGRGWGSVNPATLRRIISLLQSVNADNTPSSLLVNTGGYGNYVAELAKILHRKGSKVLLISTPCPHSPPLDGNEELLSYLRGNRHELPLLHHRSFDELPLGDESDYLSDLIGSQDFRSLLKDLESQYDWVLVAYHGSLHGIDAQCLLPEFQQIIVTVGKENYQDLQLYMDHPDKHVFFLTTGQ